MSPNGLFLGVTTIDLIYKIEQALGVDQKIMAKQLTYAAGGPATNAAIIFSKLGGEAQLFTAIGKHPLTEIIRQDLETQKVKLIDLTPDSIQAPVFSSVMVTENTGERSVVSIDVSRKVPPLKVEFENIKNQQVILVDGHQMQSSIEVCRTATKLGIPIVMDCGSWKKKTDELLGWVDYAICSEDFLPPNCIHIEDTLDYLSQKRIKKFAITCGRKPLVYQHNSDRGKMNVPEIEAVDTLGAGDFFHGAFAFYICQTNGDFMQSLKLASEVAALSCQSFGTRDWLHEICN